jgi:hypothetical protein
MGIGLVRCGQILITAKIGGRMNHNASDFDNPGISPFKGTDILEKAAAENAGRITRMVEIKNEIAKLTKPLTTESEKLLKKNVATLLRLAQEAGLAASRLADLKATDGSPFVLADSYHDEPQKACAENGEVVYRCRKPRSKDARTGCGWVKGSPIVKGYSTFHMSVRGEAGADHYCHICGKKIGSHAYTRS